ncbi:hypothetical protein HK097_000893 [Rhizophlyctis rosea]|uniref:Uncharacterized protein n=1 Tax=Rhizophlyctis rosea TaxID=64517 RepID=A0AAD5S7T2_9FUNG|nr:hypothetical protein HK097_000893 [Rhizophlyctis rosea]
MGEANVDVLESEVRQYSHNGDNRKRIDQERIKNMRPAIGTLQSMVVPEEAISDVPGSRQQAAQLAWTMATG